MVYAVGHISGAHFNPAVTLGPRDGRAHPGRDVVPYIVAQLVGAFLGAGGVLLVARAAPGGYSAAASGLGANGFGAHSPGGYSASGVFFIEVVMSFFFILVILGVTSTRGLKSFAGVAIGFCLTLVHLVDIPVTNCSVNPARSTGPALFVGGWAMAQLWMFWVAPILGAVIAGLAARALEPEQARAEGPAGARGARNPASGPPHIPMHGS